MKSCGCRNHFPGHIFDMISLEAFQMKKKVRAAAYGRVSTEKDDQVNSLISQREYFSDYIRQHEDWELTGIYYDM